MLSSLSDPILPIFAILGLGFCLYRLKMFDVPAAQSINKFVFYVATPAIIFSIVSGAPVSELDVRALGIYSVAQLSAYLGTFLFTRFVLGLEKREALLLGMTTAFVNHVFFVLPIAERIYGASAAKPIAGIVLIDIAVLFCGTVLAMDLMQTTRPSFTKVTGLLIRNPFLIASVLGISSWFIGSRIPSGVGTFAEFAGAAAAPASLFALGIVLASRPLRPVGMATWSVVFIKIVVHPVLVFAFSQVVATAPGWDRIILLVSAGPCGAMPFVIALRYGVNTDAIAKAILVSTIVSLASLSLLTA
jgi:predicted permease